MEYKGGKKQEDVERGGGMCPVCVGGKEFPSLILKWAEERYEVFLACVSLFETRGMP